MSTYQGSDWFKNGAHVRVNPAESKKQLVHQASQQLADYSKKLQLAYDGGLALFKNNFIGTDGQASTKRCCRIFTKHPLSSQNNGVHMLTDTGGSANLGSHTCSEQ